MAFTNPIVAGLQLVRKAIQSAGFVPGSAGWQIARDGSAEFNTVVMRGDLIIGQNVGDGLHLMEILQTPPPEIAFFGVAPYVGGIIWRLSSDPADPRYHFYAMYGPPHQILVGAYDVIHGVRIYYKVAVDPTEDTAIQWGDPTNSVVPELFNFVNSRVRVIPPAILEAIPLAYKAAATARTSTITVTADPDLTLTLPPNGTFSVEAVLRANGNGGDLRTAWDVVGVTVLRRGVIGAQAATTDVTNTAMRVSNHSAGTEVICGTVSSDGTYLEKLLVQTATDPGTITLLWAQGTSSVNPTTLGIGSSLEGRPVLLPVPPPIPGTPPTFVSATATAWTPDRPNDSLNVPVLAGDRIVVFGATEQDGITLGTPGDGVTTYTLKNSVTGTGGLWCGTYLWEGNATTSATLTITVAKTAGTGHWGFLVVVYRGSSGLGASTAINSSGTPSLGINTTQPHSVIFMCSTDWNTTPGAVTYPTVDGNAATQREYTLDSNYTTYAADWVTTTAGAKTVGISTPTGQKFATIALEIMGS